MKGLTQKQHEILNYIQKYIAAHHYSPSYREIMQNFSFASPGSVYKHIQTLKRKGVLINEEKCSRSLSLVHASPSSKPSSEVELPFIGNISSGYPIEMFVQTQTILVPAFMIQVPENTYVLRAQGDFLNDESINDGDLLLVEARSEAQSGETVVALINQHDTLIKRYYPEGQYIRLEGTHPNQQSLILRQDHILIQGVLVGLLRSY